MEVDAPTNSGTMNSQASHGNVSTVSMDETAPVSAMMEVDDNIHSSMIDNQIGQASEPHMLMNDVTAAPISIVSHEQNHKVEDDIPDFEEQKNDLPDVNLTYTVEESIDALKVEKKIQGHRPSNKENKMYFSPIRKPGTIGMLSYSFIFLYYKCVKHLQVDTLLLFTNLPQRSWMILKWLKSANKIVANL